jgi:serine/threonine protein kinase
MKIPGYNIEQQIGQGGMAVVYHAIQESLGRPVALKVMNPLLANSPEFSERSLNEGCLLASLRHSHIMTIYNIGVSGDYHYLSEAGVLVHL